MSTTISIFNFFSDVSREVGGVLMYHQWCLGRDLEPPVINFFSKQKKCSRTSGNVLNGILALSDRQTEPSGAHSGPFSFFAFFYLIGIIGRPFRHNRGSWRHNNCCTSLSTCLKKVEPFSILQTGPKWAPKMEGTYASTTPYYA